MPDAVDFSASYVGTPITDALVGCWKARGVRRAVISLRPATGFQGLVRACVNGGLEVEAYLYLYWSQSGMAQGRAALIALNATGIRRVWLDVETDADNPVAGDPKQTLDAAASQLTGYELGIYTSRTMWQAVMGNCALYSAWPLWDASYDGTGRTAFLAYGGWLERAMHQYAGSADLCGANVDLNMIEEEEDVKPFMAWDKDRQRAYLIGPWGAAWITAAADVAALEGLYGKTTVAFSASTIDAIGAA